MFKKLLDPTGIKAIKKVIDDKSVQELFPMVILTGAGISKESGIDTFRDKDGLWEGHRVEEVCRPESFEINPGPVWNFYNMRREKAFDSSIKPNLAHLALTTLQTLGEVNIITQNVDDLHEQALSKDVIHMHGDLKRNRCHQCKNVYLNPAPLSRDIQCPQCQELGEARPNVVFFKETPLFGHQCLKLVSTCKTFVAIGTSGMVYPAAHYVVYSKTNKALTIEINPEETSNSYNFDLHLRNKATLAVPEFVKLIEEKLKK